MGRSCTIVRAAVVGAVAHLAIAASESRAVQFATSVINYEAGAGVGSFTIAEAALGLPAGDTSFGVLTPFNAAFLNTHIVGLGTGGSLTVAFAAPASTGAGAALGVHAAVGIIDTDWPNGSAGPTATPYTNPRSAEVLVSDDGVRWHSLGTQVFDIPTNFYSHGVTSPGYQELPGTQVADFGQPFTQPLSSFDGRNWSSILTLLDGSAGGKWLNLTGVPYPLVRFVRFDVTGTDQRMYVDAVAVIPEPGAIGAGTVLILGALRRTRRG